ncbi:hypothetical protein SPM84_25290, partial [Enterobacter hormaechei subsp. hoffmannii]
MVYTSYTRKGCWEGANQPHVCLPRQSSPKELAPSLIKGSRMDIIDKVFQQEDFSRQDLSDS